MAYSELIKNLDSIRDYMREFYVFGFKSRHEIMYKSKRSYDNERRRIESWLGKYMSFRYSTSGKAVFLSLDSRCMAHNPLYDVFKAKSFTDKDITLHFFLLDILCGDEAISFHDIVDGLYNNYFEKIDNMLQVDDSTIRNKLNEYIEMGLIEREKNGRTYNYKLTENEIDISSWKNALDFFSEIGPLGALGSFIKPEKESESEIFRYKHHYFLYALDSEILCRLLEAIHEHCHVEITLLGRKTKKIATYDVLPIRIYVSTQNGKEYVFVHDYVKNNFYFIRLDNIRNVRIGRAEPKWKKYEKDFLKFRKNLWGVSVDSLKIKKRVDHFEMTLHVDDDEYFILQRLEREKRNGRVEKIDDNTYLYITDTYDAMEMIPWIRTFICRIENMECSNPEVAKRFKDDLEEMYKMYGVGDENDFQ